MAEKLLIGSGSTVYQSDSDSSGQVEVDFTTRIKTKGFAPAGLYGDVVFRRVSLTVSHEAGFQLRVLPLLDGVVLNDSVVVFSSSAVPSGDRETLVLDISLGILEESGHAKGARGSNLQLIIETMPYSDGGNKYALAGPLHIDSIQILYAGGHVAAPGAAQDGGNTAKVRSTGTP